MSTVFAGPPRSGVCRPLAGTRPTAFMRRRAASFSPRWSSIIAAVQKVAGPAGRPPSGGLNSGPGGRPRNRPAPRPPRRGPGWAAPAPAGVLASGILAHHDPVDVLAVDERALHAGQHARGTHVGVLVEALADRQAQTPQRHVIGHFAAACGTEEDRVEGLQLLEAACGNVVAVREEIRRAPREMLDLESEAAVGGRQRLQHLEPGRHDLGADSVAADGGYLVDAHDLLLTIDPQIVRHVARRRFQDDRTEIVLKKKRRGAFFRKRIPA